MTMPTGYVLGDLATKAAYFSLAAAAFIFVAMTLARSSSLSFQPTRLLHFSIGRTNSL
jgi:hypothetical protein